MQLSRLDENTSQECSKICKQYLVRCLAKQGPIVVQSTCRAEYITAAEAENIMLWVRHLVNELQVPTQQPQLHVNDTAAV